MLSILFLCTGNTCRSPMAEAVAKHWLNQTKNSNHIQVSSAGTCAAPDLPSSPEAIIALKRQNIAYEGKSQRLTKELISQHNVIFAMTQEHFHHTQEMIENNNMENVTRVLMLHPEKELQDPLGKGQEPYDELMDEFANLIPSQLIPFLPS